MFVEPKQFGPEAFAENAVGFTLYPVLPLTGNDCGVAVHTPVFHVHDPVHGREPFEHPPAVYAGVHDSVAPGAQTPCEPHVPHCPSLQVAVPQSPHDSVWLGPQTPPHAPALHVWFAPHAPPLFTHWPLLQLCGCCPEQRVAPGPHAPPHVPERHVVVLPHAAPLLLHVPSAPQIWGCWPLQLTSPGAQIPVHDPATQVWWTHAGPFDCHAPSAPHDCGCCPLHFVCVGAHVPVHAPATHVWFAHATEAPQVPAGEQVSTPLPSVEHCVAPGVQPPTHAPPMHAWFVHTTVCSHADWVPSGWQVICPGLQRSAVAAPPSGRVVQLSG